MGNLPGRRRSPRLTGDESAQDSEDLALLKIQLAGMKVANLSPPSPQASRRQSKALFLLRRGLEFAFWYFPTEYLKINRTRMSV